MRVSQSRNKAFKSLFKIQTILSCFQMVYHSKSEKQKYVNRIWMSGIQIPSCIWFEPVLNLVFKQVILLSIAGRVYEGLDDPLHAYITGATAEDVQSAVKKITDLVNLHVYNPESEQVCQIFK